MAAASRERGRRPRTPAPPHGGDGGGGHLKRRRRRRTDGRADWRPTTRQAAPTVARRPSGRAEGRRAGRGLPNRIHLATAGPDPSRMPAGTIVGSNVFAGPGQSMDESSSSVEGMANIRLR